MNDRPAYPWSEGDELFASELNAAIANGGRKASDAPPLMDGTAAAGVSELFARGDHVHPSDASRLALSGGTLTGALHLAGDPIAPEMPVTLAYFNANESGAGSGAGGAVPEAPTDGTTYGRGMGAWTGVLPLAGGTMGGALNLFGTPSAGAHAAPKSYVDAQDGKGGPPSVSMGGWNASTNAPALGSGGGTQGQYYVVTAAGNTTLDGQTNWKVGDRAHFQGGKWIRKRGPLGVMEFGATLDGIAVDNSGYIAARAAATAGATITVPYGRQNITTTLSGGPAGALRWLMDGTTSASGGSPILTLNGSAGYDLIETALTTGTKYFGRGNANLSNRGAVLRVDGNYNLPAPGGAGGGVDTFEVNTTLTYNATGTDQVVTGAQSVLSIYGATTNPATAFVAYARRYRGIGDQGGGNAGMFGSNIAAFDRSGLPNLDAQTAGNQATAMEFDQSGNGPDQFSTGSTSKPDGYGTRQVLNIIAQSSIPAANFSVRYGTIAIVSAGSGMTNGVRTFTVAGGAVVGGYEPCVFKATVAGGSVQAGTIVMLATGNYTVAPDGTANLCTVDSGGSNATFSFTLGNALPGEFSAGVLLRSGDYVRGTVGTCLMYRGFDFQSPWSIAAYGTVYAVPTNPNAVAFGMAMTNDPNTTHKLGWTGDINSPSPTFGPVIYATGASTANGSIVLDPTGTGTVQVIGKATASSTVAGDPATTLTTKSYVDTFVPLTGGTLTGDTAITGNFYGAGGIAPPSDVGSNLVTAQRLVLPLNQTLLWNAYADTTNALKYVAPGYAGNITTRTANGDMRFTIYASGATAGTPLGASKLMIYAQDGSLTVPGPVAAAGATLTGDVTTTTSNFYGAGGIPKPGGTILGNILTAGRIVIPINTTYSWNCYYDGSSVLTYATSSYAASVLARSSNGSIQFVVYPSGTAGAAVGAGKTLTFDQAGALSIPGTMGFNGTAAPASKPTVTGSRGGNAALASLLTVLAATGILTDSTTA